MREASIVYAHERGGGGGYVGGGWWRQDGVGVRACVGGWVGGCHGSGIQANNAVVASVTRVSPGAWRRGSCPQPLISRRLSRRGQHLQAVAKRPAQSLRCRRASTACSCRHRSPPSPPPPPPPFCLGGGRPPPIVLLSKYRSIPCRGGGHAPIWFPGSSSSRPRADGTRRL